nr:hypothetical protein [Singulisphaera sp. GP187]
MTAGLEGRHQMTQPIPIKVYVVVHKNDDGEASLGDGTIPSVAQALFRFVNVPQPPRKTVRHPRRHLAGMITATVVDNQDFVILESGPINLIEADKRPLEFFGPVIGRNSDRDTHNCFPLPLFFLSIGQATRDCRARDPWCAWLALQGGNQFLQHHSAGS